MKTLPIDILRDLSARFAREFPGERLEVWKDHERECFVAKIDYEQLALRNGRLVLLHPNGTRRFAAKYRFVWDALGDLERLAF